MFFLSIALLSNPPYVPRKDISDLEPEILLYEDLRALDGGKDGLDVINAIFLLCQTRQVNVGFTVLIELTTKSYKWMLCKQLLASQNSALRHRILPNFLTLKHESLYLWNVFEPVLYPFCFFKHVLTTHFSCLQIEKWRQVVHGG